MRVVYLLMMTVLSVVCEDIRMYMNTSYIHTCDHIRDGDAYSSIDIHTMDDRVYDHHVIRIYTDMNKYSEYTDSIDISVYKCVNDTVCDVYDMYTVYIYKTYTMIMINNTIDSITHL